MATVIAVTSPLQYLFQVGLIELLRNLFETVYVPVAVRDELRVGRSLGFDVPDPADHSWISIRPTTACASARAFRSRARRACGALPGPRARRRSRTAR